MHKMKAGHRTSLLSVHGKIVTWKRRHFKKLVTFVLALITIFFVLKIQSLIHNLSQEEQLANNMELTWTFSKMGKAKPLSDKDTALARNQFAKLGISMIKLTHMTLKGSRQEQDANSRSIDGQISSDPKISDILKGSSPSTDPDNVGLFLAILVVSRPNNVLFRQAVRKTWGLNLSEMGATVQFLVGRDEHWDDIVDRESRMHNDLVIIEEQDTYEYLPNKVLEGFVWALRQAPKPKFVMKVDDDTILNVPYLIQELRSNVINSSQILGAVCVNSSVIRDFGDKWSVSFLDFPFPTYPPYVFGGAYVMSLSAASCIMQARAKTFDWLQLEDVYVTGLLAGKCGITPRGHPAFSHWSDSKASACDFVLNLRISSVNHTEHEFFQIYSDIQELLRSKNITRCNTAL
ncbi:beta-1,3-galactosyltransferase 5 [Aplysia californica]|uniref:Hexosyltransferase n=1 Tax=Aplysia californica TaxID=6500 RepID=A0ABM0JPY7_APLCA|nr:beta-1,3-galactosyltransferase 5 [Aplysia californica]